MTAAPAASSELDSPAGITNTAHTDTTNAHTTGAVRITMPRAYPVPGHRTRKNHGAFGSGYCEHFFQDGYVRMRIVRRLTIDSDKINRFPVLVSELL